MRAEDIIKRIGENNNVYIFYHYEGDISDLCKCFHNARINYKLFTSLQNVLEVADKNVVIVVLNAFYITTHNDFLEELHYEFCKYKSQSKSKSDVVISTRENKVFRHLTSLMQSHWLKSYLCVHYIAMNDIVSAIKRKVVYPHDGCSGYREITINYYHESNNNHPIINLTRGQQDRTDCGKKMTHQNSQSNVEEEFEAAFNDIKSKSPSNINYASVFAPSKIKLNDILLVQVFVYKNSMHSFVIGTAKQADKTTEEKFRIPLNYNIEKNDEIKITLNLISDFDGSQTKTTIWDGDYSKVTFYVPVDYDKFKRDKIYAQIFIEVKNVVVCEMNFITEIVGINFWSKLFYKLFSSTKIKLADIKARCFHKIFISYSHKDEERVKLIAEGYNALNVDYFFDKHYLRSGDIFSEEIQN